jgi:undecaprenyl-diphosphatase
MITFFQALILGIVEGITEFLPISSTAHLDITTRLLGIVHNEFVSSFMIVIQLGAIAAVEYCFLSRLSFQKI